MNHSLNYLRLVIIFLGKLFEDLKSKIIFDGREKAGFMLCNRSTSQGSIKLLPEILIVPEKDDYISRSACHYKLKNEFINRVMNQALQEKKDVVQCHSHPFNPGIFSGIDQYEELRFKRHVDDMIANIHQAGIVFSKDSETIDSWFYNPSSKSLQRVDKVVVVYEDQLKIHLPHGKRENDAEAALHSSYDRTIRAFGKEALRVFNNLCVGVVGASGTGAIVIEQLARLGVGRILVCDPDSIEETNLNRLQGATHQDIGENKAEFARERIININPACEVIVFPCSIYQKEVQEEFSQVDVILSCVDSGAVHSLNRLAMANLIPLFVFNSGLEAKDGKIQFIGGHVLNLIPGKKVCVTCLGMFENLYYQYLDEAAIELERSQGYIKNSDIPDPSVYFLNMAVVAQGIWNFTQYTLGLSPNLPEKIYLDLLKNIISAGKIANPKGCIVCGEDGFLGKGDLIPFLVPNKYLDKDSELLQAGNIPRIDGTGSVKELNETLIPGKEVLP